MHRYFIVSSLAFVLVLSGHASAQTSLEQTGSDTVESQSSAADQAFEPIAKRFKRLYDSLRSLGGLSEENRRFVEQLREEVRAFSRQFPDDLRGPATELTLSSWLKDTKRLEEIYAELLRIAPEKHEIRIAWADRLRAQHKYREAIDVLRSGNIDPAKNPQAYISLSENLFSENSFQESLDALNQIPQSVLDTQPQVKSQVDSVKKTREDYLNLWKVEESLRAQEQAADDLPRAVIETDKGPILIELFENHAPNTVANFINLAEKGYYDGIKFHRVEPNFMAQTGDPNTKEGGTGNPGEGGPGYTIPDEHLKEDRRNHFAGSVAMAKTAQPNSAGSQFYLNHVPTPWLNGQHTVFGRIIEGLNVARSIKKDDLINTIKIIRKRDHDYVPNTLPLNQPPAQPESSSGLELQDESTTTQPESSEEIGHDDRPADEQPDTSTGDQEP